MRRANSWDGRIFSPAKRPAKVRFANLTRNVSNAGLTTCGWWRKWTRSQVKWAWCWSETNFSNGKSYPSDKAIHQYAGLTPFMAGRMNFEPIQLKLDKSA
jgi:hypothetical protein